MPLMQVQPLPRAILAEALQNNIPAPGEIAAFGPDDWRDLAETLTPAEQPGRYAAAVRKRARGRCPFQRRLTPPCRDRFTAHSLPRITRGDRAMNDIAFGYTNLFTNNLPPAGPRFSGFPKFNFIGGHNDPVSIPSAALAEAADAVIRRDGHHLAMYNLGLGPQGYPPLRAFVADKLTRHRGIKATADDVLITTGSGQSVDLISALLIQPGDTVLIEEFCYAGAINRFRKVGATVLPVPLDDDGMKVDALATILADLKAKVSRRNSSTRSRRSRTPPAASSRSIGASRSWHSPSSTACRSSRTSAMPTCCGRVGRRMRSMAWRPTR
jgi:hypothetical protein